MRIWITALVFFASVSLGHAQSAGLRFDQNWIKLGIADEKFSLTKSLSIASNTPQKPMPHAWRYSDLAFFCKMEVKMEKATRFPIKFRLGDVQYVDRLEGKRANY